MPAGEKSAAPAVRGGIVARSVSLALGLFVFALGIVLQVESELGLPPWDVLNQGIAKQTPLTFGMANVAVAVLVMAAAWRLGARLGPGTVANAILVGTFIDLLLLFDSFDDPPLVLRVALLAGGVACIGIGSAFYIGAMLGAGPRDSLMLVLTRRSGWRVGTIRALIESGATVAGFALGGTVGIGTLAFALAVGPVVETSFAALRRSPLALRDHPGPRPDPVTVADAH